MSTVVKTQQSSDVHVYIHTLHCAKSTEHSLEGKKKPCPMQLFSTFQRQAFSSNPTIQQSIPVYRLALF